MRKFALLFLTTPLLAQFDPAAFQSPPAEFRGHAMWSLPLTTLNESYITSGIEEMAKLNYGGFFIEAGGGPTTGLSDAYIKLFRRGQTDNRGVVYLSIHKVKDGRDFYFFANSSPKSIDTKVVLRGDRVLRIWNPHTGRQERAEFTAGEAAGQKITTVQLTLPSVSSLFYVSDATVKP